MSNSAEIAEVEIEDIECVVDELVDVLVLIDKALIEYSSRSLVSSLEINDLLLDIRSIIANN